MPIQCKGFSACIRHFSRRVRSPRAAALILGSCPAGVPGENLSSDAVVVQIGGIGGYLPPIPPGAGAAGRRRVGSGSRSACPVGSCRSCARCRRFDKSTYHFDNSGCHFVHSSEHSSQSTGYYKQIKHLVVLVVCQLLDRFPVASRVRAALFVRSLFDYIECLPTL